MDPRLKKTLIRSSIIIGIFALILLSFFIATYTKAVNVYSEQVLIEAPEMDFAVSGNSIYLVYAKNNELVFEERKFNTRLIDSKLITEGEIQSLAIYVCNDQVIITWQLSNKKNYYYIDGGIVPFGENIKEIIPIVSGDKIYLSYLDDDTIYIKNLNSDDVFIIDYFITEYSITYYGEYVYFVYNKQGVIYYRMFKDGLSISEKMIAAGTNPHLLINSENIYIYCYDDFHNLICYYGNEDTILFKQELSNYAVTDFQITSSSIVILYETNIYCQFVDEEGFTDTILVGSGDTITVDERGSDTVVVYNDGITHFLKVIECPKDFEQGFPTFDIAQTYNSYNRFSNAGYYVEDYLYTEIWGAVDYEENPVMQLISQHTLGSLSVMFALVAFFIIIGNTVFIYKKENGDEITAP